MALLQKQRICSVETCPRPHNSKGYCRKHYLVWRRNGTPISPRNHGKSGSEGYQVWQAMKDRCNNPRNKSYKYYGGRGIRVCDRWLESYANFLADMGTAPKGMQLDRIDNDGNYEPSNCRWATRSQQILNRRYSNPSGYRGVYRRPSKKWYASIVINGKHQVIGTFDDIEEAALAWDSAAIQLHGDNAILNLLGVK